MAYSKMLRRYFKTNSSRQRAEAGVRVWRSQHNRGGIPQHSRNLSHYEWEKRNPDGSLKKYTDVMGGHHNTQAEADIANKQIRDWGF